MLATLRMAILQPDQTVSQCHVSDERTSPVNAEAYCAPLFHLLLYGQGEVFGDQGTYGIFIRISLMYKADGSQTEPPFCLATRRKKLRMTFSSCVTLSSELYKVFIVSLQKGGNKMRKTMKALVIFAVVLAMALPVFAGGEGERTCFYFGADRPRPRNGCRYRGRHLRGKSSRRRICLSIFLLWNSQAFRRKMQYWFECHHAPACRLLQFP